METGAEHRYEGLVRRLLGELLLLWAAELQALAVRVGGVPIAQQVLAGRRRDYLEQNWKAMERLRLSIEAHNDTTDKREGA